MIMNEKKKAVVQFDKVSKSFVDVQALSKVTFEVNAGEISLGI